MRFLFVQCLAIMCLSEVLSSSSNRHKRDVRTCGSSIRNSGLVVHGTSFSRGNFPWIVALINTKDRANKFFCAGTLVSNRHVITGENRDLPVLVAKETNLKDPIVSNSPSHFHLFSQKSGALHSREENPRQTHLSRGSCYFRGT